jgi:hypothetical protein
VSADINGDGNLDLAVANSSSDNVSVLLGKGDGTFGPARLFPTGLNPRGLAVGHFQGRARPDLMTCNARSGNVAVLLNRPATAYLAVTWVGITAIDSDGMTCTISVGAFPAENTPKQTDARYTGTVRFSSSDRRAVLPADCTFGPADKGSRSFRVKFRTPGSQTVTVTDSRGQRLAGSAAVWALRTTDLRLRLDAPKTVTAGKPFTVSVNVFDPFGVWTPGYGGRIHFRCTDTGAMLPADYTCKRDASVHTFTSAFILRTPGTWTLTVSDTDLPKLTATAMVTVRAGS